MPHRQLIDALFVPGIDLLGGLQYRRHLRLRQVAVLSQLPQNFHIVSHSVVSPPSCKDRRGNLSAPVSLFTKASQSSRPQTLKIGIIFHRDMRVGKNTSQTASVEFLRPEQNYARSRLQTFWQKNQRFFARCLNTPRPSRYRWCIPCRTPGTCPWCRTASGACSGWKHRPFPSWPARTPDCRTTWSGRSRPCRRPSP